MCETGDRENRGAIIHSVKNLHSFCFLGLQRICIEIKKRKENIKDENNTAEIAIY